MNESNQSYAIIDGELLARFILFKSYIRADNTIRPDAFIPAPHVELSVTRINNLPEMQLWDIGDNIASQSGRKLVGRGDVFSIQFMVQGLQVVAAPVPENPYHANVADWPKEKQNQKLIAVEIAAAAKFTAKTDNLI